METGRQFRAWRGVMSAACAVLCGIGLARFAYTPLIPAVVAAGWFTPAAAVQLGAANLAGYLAGAILVRRIARRIGTRAALRGAMLLAAASLFACTMPAPFAWFALWRFLAGLSGAVLMVLAAPAVLPMVAPARRGLAGGLIFTGVGTGIAASGLLIPWLLRFGLGWTWGALGVLSLLLAALAWTGWPADQTDMPVPAAGPVPSESVTQASAQDFRLRWLYLAYALNAVALVPHMVFLADWVARGLGQGIVAGSRQWALFGLGAMAGPVVLGRLADRIGFGRALRLAYGVQAVAVMLPLAVPWTLSLCSPVMGAFAPGITALMLGRVGELVPDRPGQAAAWRLSTLAFALGQAAGSYGFAALFTWTGTHTPLFASAAALLATVVVLDAPVLGWAGRPRESARPQTGI